MNIQNLKIGMRLSLAFFIIILMVMILSSISMKSLASIGNKWAEFSEVSLEKRRLANNSNAELGYAVHQFKDYVLRGGDYDKKFNENISNIVANVDAYEKITGINAEEKSLIVQVYKGIDTYTDAMKKAVQMKSDGKSVQEIDQSIKGADKEIAKAWNDVLVIVRQEAAATGKSVSDTIVFAKYIIVTLTLLIIILSAICAYLVTRSITRPIGQALQTAEKVASGDLTSEIETSSGDEMGQLLRALKK